MRLSKEKIRKIPLQSLSLLGLIEMGIDPLEKMSIQTFSRHKQLLAAYDVDIMPELKKLRHHRESA